VCWWISVELPMSNSTKIHSMSGISLHADTQHGKANTVNLPKWLLGNHTVMSMGNYSSSRLISIMFKPSVLFHRRHS
jgi:hypothetical protein